MPGVFSPTLKLRGGKLALAYDTGRLVFGPPCTEISPPGQSYRIYFSFRGLRCSFDDAGDFSTPAPTVERGPAYSANTESFFEVRKDDTGERLYFEDGDSITVGSTRYWRDGMILYGQDPNYSYGLVFYEGFYADTVDYRALSSGVAYFHEGAFEHVKSDSLYSPGASIMNFFRTYTDDDGDIGYDFVLRVLPDLKIYDISNNLVDEIMTDGEGTAWSTTGYVSDVTCVPI